MLNQTANGIAAPMLPNAGLMRSFAPAPAKRCRLGGDLKAPEASYCFTTAGKSHPWRVGCPQSGLPNHA